jgi:PKD repeat protein
MSRIFFIILLSILFIGGCKKDYPDDDPTDTDKPVFYFSGNVNYVPVKIEAGVNDYYMYSFYKKDSNNVYNFFGQLKQINCINCVNQIKFQINDYTTSSSVNTDIKKSFTENYYPFLKNSPQDGTPNNFLVNFRPQHSGNNTAINYMWDLGDGTKSNSDFITHTYSYPGYYDVNCTVNFLNSCTSIYSTKLAVGMPDSAQSFITIDTISGNFISLTGRGNGNTTGYLWDFGDGSTNSTVKVVSHTYSQPGVYKVVLQTTDSLLGSASVSKNIVTENYLGCAADFAYEKQPLYNAFAFSNIMITWTDNLGVEYTSKKVNQPLGSYFKIVSIEDYSDNENKEPTKKLHIQFSCVLSDGTYKVKIHNGDAVIAVSYKK